MAKGDDGKTSNTTPSWQSGSLNVDPISAEGLNSAMRGDIAANYLKGPTQTSYVGMGPGTTNAMEGLLRQASSGQDLIGRAGNYYKGVLGDNGLTAAQRDAAGQLGNVSSLYHGIVAQGGLTGDQRGAIDYFKTVMDGSGTAPGYETLRANAMDDARTAVNQQFGASGRFGAGSHVSDLGRGITDAVAGLDYRNYEADLARKAAAASGIFNMGQTGQGNVANALQGIYGANTGIFNMAQTGQANAGAAAGGLASLYEQTLTPQRINVAQQSAIDADRQGAAAFDPYLNHLANYQGLLGTNAGAPQPEQPFNWRDGMGIGLGLLSAFL